MRQQLRAAAHKLSERPPKLTTHKDQSAETRRLPLPGVQKEDRDAPVPKSSFLSARTSPNLVASLGCLARHRPGGLVRSDAVSARGDGQAPVLTRSLISSALGTPTPPGNYVLSVPAADMWWPTGLVLRNGEVVSFSAKGSWSYEGDGAYVGPDGGPPGCISGGGSPVAGAPCNSLVGMVGGMRPFEVGTHKRVVVSIPAPAMLHLGMNDAFGEFGDNEGDLTVEVSILVPITVNGFSTNPASDPYEMAEHQMLAQLPAYALGALLGWRALHAPGSCSR